MNSITKHRTMSLIIGLTLAGSLAACGGSDEASAGSDQAASGSSDAPSGTVSASDQDGDGTTLKVDSVDLEGVEQGWIAVHSDVDGKPGPVVGTAEVQQGANSDVVVTLDETVATGAFWPMLHIDDSELGTYEFPEVDGADLPVTDGEMPVMQQITLTVG